MSSWYFKNGEKEFGPFAAHELQDKAESGWIGPATLVREDSDESWTRASETGMFQQSVLSRNVVHLPWTAGWMLRIALTQVAMSFVAGIVAAFFAPDEIQTPIAFTVWAIVYLVFHFRRVLGRSRPGRRRKKL